MANYIMIHNLTSSISDSAPYMVTLQGQVIPDNPAEEIKDIEITHQYAVMKAKCWWAFQGDCKTPKENLKAKKFLSVPPELLEDIK